jgi:hypothetical protein
VYKKLITLNETAIQLFGLIKEINMPNFAIDSANRSRKQGSFNSDMKAGYVGREEYEHAMPNGYDGGLTQSFPTSGEGVDVSDMINDPEDYTLDKSYPKTAYNKLSGATL